MMIMMIMIILMTMMILMIKPVHRRGLRTSGPAIEGDIKLLVFRQIKHFLCEIDHFYYSNKSIFIS